MGLFCVFLFSVTIAVLDKLADAVNRLAKHFACSGRVEATMSLSALLCAKECGLAPALEAVLTHGIRSFGVFQRRRLYAWDFFGAHLFDSTLIGG